MSGQLWGFIALRGDFWRFCKNCQVWRHLPWMLRRKKGARGDEVGFVAKFNWCVVVQAAALCSFGRSHWTGGKFLPVHGMKPCRERVVLQLRSILTSTPNEYERAASCPGHFTPRKGCRYTCNWRLGFRTPGGGVVRMFCRGIDTALLQTDWHTAVCVCCVKNASTGITTKITGAYSVLAENDSEHGRQFATNLPTKAFPKPFTVSPSLNCRLLLQTWRRVAVLPPVVGHNWRSNVACK